MSAHFPFASLLQVQHTILQVDAGTYLFRQGAPTQGVYYLESGRIQLYRNTRDGKDVILHAVLPGETLAEAALFVEQYHCQAKALASSIVWRFDKRALLDAIQTDPEFAESYIQRLANQVRDLRREKELLFLNDAQQRVLHAMHHGMLTGSIRQFAASICLTEEAVYRALASLTKIGDVEKTGRGCYRLAQTRR